MALTKQNKNKVKKVIKGLNKASKTHAGQAKTLKKAVGMSRGGSTVTKQVTIQNLECVNLYLTLLKQEVRVATLVSGLLVKLRC